MGMFDWVYCNRVLPDWLESRDHAFQTTDFPDPYLDIYRITPEGRLVKHNGYSEAVPESERINKIVLERRFIKTGEKDLNYHGYLHFYDTIDSTHYSYKAKFTDGNLVAIEVCSEDE